MPKGIYNRSKIDKNSIQYLKYKAIALEFIKQGYNNIRLIYSKYYPNASQDSIRTEPYRMLDNVCFQVALEDAFDMLKVEDLDIAREVIICLRKEMFTAKNSADRVNAASWLGKSKAMFTDKTQEVPIDKPDNQFSLERLSRIKQAETQ